MNLVTCLHKLFLTLVILFSIVTTGCTAANSGDDIPPSQTSNSSSVESTSTNSCPVTEATWAKPPEDSAVQGSAAYGHYFVNEERSIWASAWWTGQEENYLSAKEDGIKVGWFRPEGATLNISGQRIDGQASPLEAIVPCCYPTQFQATGLIFPTEGCWEVVAQAADEELSFVVWVEP
jgi:hypothetical protein